MKSSEAKPLDKEELQTLKQLLQRWILVTYPYYGGSSEESDAFTTYESIESDAEDGVMEPPEELEELQKMIADYGETSL